MHYYKVTGLTFGTDYPTFYPEIDRMGFAPFKLSSPEIEQPVFTLTFNNNLLFDFSKEGINSFDFDDLFCSFGVDDNAYWLKMTNEHERFILYMPLNDSRYQTNLTPDRKNSYYFRFMLWTAFGVAALPHLTVAIHASAVSYRGQSILFLGESGTGKSTHTRLWLTTFEGADLLNDDSPFISIIKDTPICFGTPWSGKTACFINNSFPVKAIVRLSQAPHNQIRRLSKMEAFGAVYPSCPPSFAHNENLSDLTCSILSSLINKVPFYHLECLPNAEAAHLVRDTVFNDF